MVRRGSIKVHPQKLTPLLWWGSGINSYLHSTNDPPLKYHNSPSLADSTKHHHAIVYWLLLCPLCCTLDYSGAKGMGFTQRLFKAYLCNCAHYLMGQFKVPPL